jgi:hypothetical protein
MKKIAVVLVFLLYTPHFFSQGGDTAHYPQYWIEGGVALGFFTCHTGASLYLENFFLSARYKYAIEFVEDQHTPVYQGVDFQIGKAFDLGKSITFSTSCGIEHYTYGKDIFNDDNPWGYYQLSTGNAFIAEVSLIGRLSKYFGFGLNCGKTFGAKQKIILLGLSLYGRLPI